MRSKGRLMQKIIGSRKLRTVYSVLFILNTIFLICAGQSFLFLKRNSFYMTDGRELQDDVIGYLMDEKSQAALRYFYDENIDPDPTQNAQEKKTLKESLQEDNCNFHFAFSKNGVLLCENYKLSPDKYGRINECTYDELIQNDPNMIPLQQLEDVSFESHLKKVLTAQDAFWYAILFFTMAVKLKYVVVALLILFAVSEGMLAFVLYSVAAGDSMRSRDLDQIPMYFLLPVLLMLGVFSGKFLFRETTVLSDLKQMFSNIEAFRSTLYMYLLLLFVVSVLLHMLLTTVSVRLHRPMWWRRSLLYRTFAARSFGQRVRTVLTIMLIVQFAIYSVAYLIDMSVYIEDWNRVQKWIYFAVDASFTLTMATLLFVVYKDMSVYIPRTRRIVVEQSGSVPTDGLSDSGRIHAENINFLSRSASAETEKRFINESFSTELIHSVSNSLREPLRDVAENVRMLESGRMTDEQSRHSIERIVSLSQELKKTIEDMILISKASTGNLPLEPVATDAGMMLSQAVGEFYAQFEEKGVEPVVEQPDEPILIRADGQYMWYVFEGILSVMLENAVAGTRLFLRASRAGENAVMVFRCTVRAQAGRQLHELSGMGLASAKVFSMLQGGSMVDHLAHDTLTAVLQFPMIASDESE